MYRYSFEFGSYYLRDSTSQKIIFMSDSVAFAFDVGCGVMLKHGHPDLVLKWHTSTVQSLRQSENPIAIEMAKNYIVIVGKFDIEKMNKLLNNSTYAKSFLKEWFKENVN